MCISAELTCAGATLFAPYIVGWQRSKNPPPQIGPTERNRLNFNVKIECVTPRGLSLYKNFIQLPLLPKFIIKAMVISEKGFKCFVDYGYNLATKVVFTSHFH